VRQEKYLRNQRVFVIMSASLTTQNTLLLDNLKAFYARDNNLEKILGIINGESQISLRIVDWFATNYSKKYWTTYDVPNKDGGSRRFKVYMDYKLKLKAYSKRRFDPFCRWDRTNIPYGKSQLIQTTIGQLNFFKWALENGVIQHIEQNYAAIERDMNSRNSTNKKRQTDDGTNKTRKKREELSICASKSIKKENVKIRVTFD